jgi:hypothetical protein
MSGPLSYLRGSVAMGSLAALILACSTPTDQASQGSILVHRAMWKAQNLANYSYTYEFYAFNFYAEKPLRLEVRQDTVRFAVVLATGDTIRAAYFPTIDMLFDRALQASQDGSLKRITFDPVRGYPTSLGYAAIPDALSSEQASALQPNR